MRKIEENELEKVTKQILEIFFDEITIATTVKGINSNTAREIMYENLYRDMEYFYKYGNIFVYDDDFSGIVTLIDGKQFSIIKKTLLSLKSNKKILSIASKEEIKLLRSNAKKVQKIHSYNWYKKRKNIPFYVAHLGIDKDKRGQGIFREMMDFLFDYVKNYNNEIALETFTLNNVEIYEHFGFEVVDKSETKNKKMIEYRMIKRI